LGSSRTREPWILFAIGKPAGSSGPEDARGLLRAQQEPTLNNLPRFTTRGWAIVAIVMGLAAAACAGAAPYRHPGTHSGSEPANRRSPHQLGRDAAIGAAGKNGTMASEFEKNLPAAV